MEKSKGWVTIHRKIIDSEIWLQEPWRLKTWIYLIMEANHEEEVRYGWKLKRGQVYIKNLADLCNQIGWKKGFISDKPKVNAMKQFWEWLRQRGMVDTKKTTRGTVITILNYGQYQDIMPKAVDTMAKPLLDTNQTPMTSQDRQPLELLNKKQNAFSSEEKLKISIDYKKGNKTYKPFYKGDEMRWVDSKKKWYVIVKGEWLEFADKDFTIEWRPRF